jgi:hypothetical protein
MLTDEHAAKFREFIGALFERAKDLLALLDRQRDRRASRLETRAEGARRGSSTRLANSWMSTAARGPRPTSA